MLAPLHRFVICAALGLAALTSAVLSQDAQPSEKADETAKEEAETEAEPIKQAPRLVDPRAHKVGELIPDMAFTDITGREGKLSDFRGKPLVIALTNVGCPICKKYGPTIAELQAELEKQGVGLLLLNPSSGDTTEQIRQAIDRYKFTARYVHDKDGRIAAALGADSTGDSFLLDGARTLMYRGAIDDQYGIGYSVDAPRANYLRNAIRALLAGEPIFINATWAPGCALEAGAAPARGEITWHNRVSRIIENNCQECHRSGENGPFELVTLDDVKSNAAMIKRVVRSGAMPPWFADKQHGQWHNDRSLSTADKADLLAWLDGGMKVGDEGDAAMPRQWPQGWRIGKPDSVIKNPVKTKVPAKGIMPYQYSMMATSFEEDRWVQAMEIRPSAPQVVHHVLIFLQYPKDHPRAAEQPNDAGGTRGYFMGMVPGQGHVTFPEGHGKFVPKGASLMFQIHYTPNGEAVEDQTSLAVIWCKEKPRVEIKTMGISNERFRIPPGADNHEVAQSRVLRKGIRVLSLMPHMHVRGKAYRFEAHLPDGSHRILLDVPRFDFNWQLLYVLREPVDLPRGTRITCTGWFDNSDKNPANPDPTKEVRFGEQTWEEMQIGYLNHIELE